MKNDIYTTRDIIFNISSITGKSYDEIRIIVNFVFEEIKKAMANGKQVRLKNFGKWKFLEYNLKIRKTYKHHEKLGKPYTVRRLYFKPAERLKMMIYDSKKYKKMRDRHGQSSHP